MNFWIKNKKILAIIFVLILCFFNFPQKTSADTGSFLYNAYNNIFGETDIGANEKNDDILREKFLNKIESLNAKKQAKTITHEEATQLANAKKAFDDFNTKNTNKDSDPSAGATPNSCTLLSWSVGACLEYGIAWILSKVVWLFSFVVEISAMFFEFSVDQSINSIAKYADSSGVLTAWKVLRDTTNMLFLMIMMYIAIGTVLQLEGVNWKKQIGAIIMAAILINFSMTITRVVVDVTNVFAVYFYEQAKGGENGPGVATLMFQSLKLEDKISNKQSTNVSDAISLGTITIGSIGSIVLMLAGSYVLFLGGFLFIIRLISLIFLMILSPLPWIGIAVPKYGGKISGNYWEKLMNQALFAPAYTFCLYFVMKFISCADIVSIGRGGSMEMLMFNMITISLMFGAVIVAKELGASGMGLAQTGAKMAMGTTLGAGIGALSLAKGTLSGTYKGLTTTPAPGQGRTAAVFSNIGTEWSKTGGGLKTKVGMAYDTAKEKLKSPLELTGDLIKSGTGFDIMPGEKERKEQEKAEKEYKKKREIEAAKTQLNNDSSVISQLNIDESKLNTADPNYANDKLKIDNAKRAAEKRIRENLQYFKGDKILELGEKMLTAQGNEIAKWMDEAQSKAVIEKSDFDPTKVAGIKNALFDNEFNTRGKRVVETDIVQNRWAGIANDATGDALKQKYIGEMASKNIAELPENILLEDYSIEAMKENDLKKIRETRGNVLADKVKAKGIAQGKTW
ncbi:MAG: hypothetical protein UT05_C0003G0085 [Parcubacteria group bacterium GW2011_GWF2_38_76]|nr:MAG: hypothetical protein UT05_C0003G0085 [Parcubacteria group bacterium GW2011_GWF2_38_76]HBM46142.1 hypothetical protein [Patescibacteria group bacterium]